MKIFKQILRKNIHNYWHCPPTLGNEFQTKKKEKIDTRKAIRL